MSRSQPKSDLFNAPKDGGDYSAKDIEVLEGLEPVRRRPGMYIGGTDERAFHHLAAEILDNAMDEAVAGFANRIELHLGENNVLTIKDNGRGIPTDPHPKHKNKSALEIVFTVLHAGGKFSGDAYQTSGGLHGVGASVVNALSEYLEVEVACDRTLFSQRFERGLPATKLKNLGPAQNRRGSTVTFKPDEQIFGPEVAFKPSRLYRMARSKAYLFRGVEIRWSCDPKLLGPNDTTPAEETIHFPGGLLDYLQSAIGQEATLVPKPFSGRIEGKDGIGTVEWAVTWAPGEDAFIHSYCNTVPTPQGGTHDQGLRAALTKGLRNYAELIKERKAAQITADDVMSACQAMLSIFIRDPQFQGQTKDKLSSVEAQRLVENAVRDHFDHWLAGAPNDSKRLVEFAVEQADDRLKRKADKEVQRSAAGRRLRLPGKLADCSVQAAAGTEIFLVEGDSAGGSAKQARDRATQAILPLRGKILNVASAAEGKLAQNKELADLVLALGCGTGVKYRQDDLRYEKVVIMTDADVDGAHIASLLITFFYREMRGMIDQGHLYLAMPPLYKLAHGGKTVYARDDKHKDQLLKSEFRPNSKVEIGRFKGLGEMNPSQLKETTMKPGARTLLRVQVGEGERGPTDDLVERLMGKKPELRFQFIQENAQFAKDLDV